MKKLTLVILTLILNSCQEGSAVSTSSNPDSRSSAFTESYDFTCGDQGLSYLVGDWQDSSNNVVVSIQDGNCAATIHGSPAGLNGFTSYVYDLSQEKMSEFNNLAGVHDFKWGYDQRAQMSSSNSIMTVGGKALTKR